MAKEGTITIKSDPSAKELVKAWSISQRATVGIGVSRSLNAVREAMYKTTPKRTGRLLASQRVVRVSDLVREIKETVDPPYGLFIRTGVPPEKINPILPRRKKALFWPGARHPVAAVYNHPGIRKNDYWQAAIDMSRGRMEKEAESIVADIEAVIDI